MKVNRFILLMAFILLASVLTACGGTPAAASWPGLAANETIAYLANGSVLHAIRLKDGEELWSFPEKPSAKWVFYSNPVFTADGQLIVGSSGTEHSLFLVDAETGKEVWSFSDAGDHWQASPLVVGQMVYAPNADGTLYVFDLSIQGNDKLAWTLNLGDKLWSQPATDGKRIYIASLNHHVFAVDIETHELVWTTPIELGGANTGTPAISKDALFIGSFGQTVEAISTVDGSLLWTAPAKGWVWGGPIVADSTLYFADLDGNFYTVNTADGSPLTESIRPDGPILASPAVINDKVIFVTENGTVYAINPDGSIESLETLAGKLYTTPVAAGDLILVAPFRGDYTLVALDQDGKQVWYYPKEQK